MSVRAQRRPPGGGLRRVPRGDRAADQMALNGLLVRSDNSGRVYKAILTRLVAAAAARDLRPPPQSYSPALETLATLKLEERREILSGATLLYARQRLLLVLWSARVSPGSAAALLKTVVEEAGHRLRVVEGAGLQRGADLERVS